jgi:sec-independent protein translocase protein TatA
MFGLGPTELIIIAVIVLILFGAKRLPEIGKGLGGALREFKNVKKEIGKTEEADDGHEGSAPTLEAKAVNKILEQVPVAKKAAEAKKKVDKIKEIVK